MRPSTAVRAFERDERIAATVTAFVLLVSFAGAMLSAFEVRPNLQPFFFFVAAMTLWAASTSATTRSTELTYCASPSETRGATWMRLRRSQEAAEKAIAAADRALMAHSTIFKITAGTTASEHEFIAEAFVRLERLEVAVKNLKGDVKTLKQRVEGDS